MSDFVVTALDQELARVEWRERLSRRPRTMLKASAAFLLEEERRQRNGGSG
jgi:hypothetical protein